MATPKPVRKVNKLINKQARDTAKEFTKHGNLAEGPGKHHMIKHKEFTKKIKMMKKAERK